MNTTSTILTTTEEPPEEIPSYMGFISLALCIILFASHSLPVKKFETGDGMVYQMLLCTGVWLVGVVVNYIRQFPPVYFLPMVGGFIWTTSNLFAVPMIKLIGIGLSTLLWGTTTILVGWADARFGVFGIKPETPNHVYINYIAVVLTAVSAIFYVFIKIEPNNRELADENRPFLATYHNYDTIPINENVNEIDQHLTLFDNLQPKTKIYLGMFLSIFSGLLNAFSYAPYLYVIDNYDHASDDGLDYVFSTYTGVLSCSVFYVIGYCILKKNRPYVNVKSVLPGILSGVCWGLANCSFLFANSALSQAITFPIAISLRIALASIYGIFLLNEIKGKRNFIFLGLGFFFTSLGSLLCAISKF